MRKESVGPDVFSPQALMRRLRRKAAYVEAAVTVALILSICTLLYTLAAGHGSVAFRAGALA